jgi:hypothetical protein
MAFNAQSIYDRYSPSPSSNNVAVLKSDFKSICSDLLTLETYAATATSNKGKWSALYLAENTATPPTNLELTHLSGLRSTNAYYLMSSATTATSAGAVVRGIRFGADKVTSPATDIGILDLKSAARTLSSCTLCFLGGSSGVVSTTPSGYISGTFGVVSGTGYGTIMYLLVLLHSGLGPAAHTGTIYGFPYIWGVSNTGTMNGTILRTLTHLAFTSPCYWDIGVGLKDPGLVYLTAIHSYSFTGTFITGQGFTHYYQYFSFAQS